MTFSRVQRPTSVALAGVASVLLLVGPAPVGLVCAGAAVLTAWLPVRAEPQQDQ